MSVEQRPSHVACTFIMAASARVRQEPPNPAAPRGIAERTHACWCSSWKLMTDGSWRVWRKGRWVRPMAGEVKMRWVWEVDGHAQAITAKVAKELIAKGANND